MHVGLSSVLVSSAEDSVSTHFECSVVMPFNATMLYILHS